LRSAYFNLNIRNQDEYWVPHICYLICHKNLTSWFSGKCPGLPFGQPVIWREPKDHISDCYLCLTNIKVKTIEAYNKISRSIVCYKNNSTFKRSSSA